MSDEHCGEEHLLLYALDALSLEDRAGLDIHLYGCARCRLRLEQLRAAAFARPRSIIPLEPSAAGKQKLLERIRADIAARSHGSLQAPASTVHHGTLIFASAFTIPAALAGAAVCLAVITLLLAQAITSADPSNYGAAILGNPSARILRLEGTAAAPDAQGQVVMAPGQPYVVLVVSGLEPLPEDRGYQLWLIRGTKRLPGGRFEVHQQGGAAVVLSVPAPPAPSDWLGITEGPMDGGAEPDGLLVMQPVQTPAGDANQ